MMRVRGHSLRGHKDEGRTGQDQVRLRIILRVIIANVRRGGGGVFVYDIIMISDGSRHLQYTPVNHSTRVKQKR